MKKFILVLAMALGLAVSSATAGSTNTSSSLFNAGEFGFQIGSSYTVDTGAGSVKGAFATPYSLNFDGGLHYFPSKYFGLEANVPFYTTRGVSVSEVQFGGIARLPIGHLAPYVGLGARYHWADDAQKDWAVVAKVGAEWRFNAKWGVGAEAVYTTSEADIRKFDFKQGALAARAYLSFNF